MRIIYTLFIILGPLFIFAQEPLVIGESVTIHSDILKEDRKLNIYLPNGYSPDSLKKYPVIYLLDGGIDEDIIHVSGLVQFYSFPWIGVLKESIVVGITNVDRRRDLTYPSTVEEDVRNNPTSGGSAAFSGFIEKELLPYIEQHYRIDSTSTLIGQSLGGLFATQLLFENPSLFDQYIIVSPSVWWDKGSLLNKTPAAGVNDCSVYIAVGKEGKIMEKGARQLYRKLKRLKNAPGRIYFHFMKNRDHGDALHEAVSDAFEKLSEVR